MSKNISKVIYTLSLFYAGHLMVSCGEKNQSLRSSTIKTNTLSSEGLGITDRIRDFGYNFNKMIGTGGNDSINGTPGSDDIQGMDGNDTLKGMDGNDYINGNKGADNLNGNIGDDVVHGGRGNDIVHGGKGNDWVYGSKGIDHVYGDLGNDRVTGDEHSDYLDGGPGNDSYYFKIGDGNDRINDTGGGNDTLYCVGFAAAGKIGKSGNRTSIKFPSGDSIVIENANQIENTVGCYASAGPFEDNDAPRGSSSAPAPMTGICKVIGGALDVQFEANITKASCESECNNREATSPQRKCEFNGSVFRDHPKKQCLIVGRSGKVKYDMVVRRNICGKQCSSMETDHPFRKCTWGPEVMRDHPPE